MAEIACLSAVTRKGGCVGGVTERIKAVDQGSHGGPGTAETMEEQARTFVAYRLVVRS